MSMLTLNGILQNVFTKSESKDKDTGEIRPASTHAQVLAQNILESGEVRLEMVTLRVYSPDEYRALVGKFIRVPVGAFVSNGQIQYYCLKNESNPLAQ